MLVERCYDGIDVMTCGASAAAAEFADVVVDISTCVMVRDVTLLNDAHQSKMLAWGVFKLAAKYLRCCVILAPPHLHNSSASNLHNPASQE